MNKKIFLLMAFLLFAAPAFCDEWADFGNLDRAWDGQKSVTNKEFEQVMDALQEKSKKKEEKKRKKKLKKLFGTGSTLHTELNPDKEITEIPDLEPEDEGLLFSTSVDLRVEGQVLEKGFYKVIAEKNSETNKIYLNFYQSQFFKGKIEATETEDDYGESDLNFVRLLPFNDSFVKIIFGSIDFNAYTFVPFIN